MFRPCRLVMGTCTCYRDIDWKCTGGCGRDCRTRIFCAQVGHGTLCGACLTATFSWSWQPLGGLVLGKDPLQYISSARSWSRHLSAWLYQKSKSGLSQLSCTITPSPIQCFECWCCHGYESSRQSEPAKCSSNDIRVKTVKTLWNCLLLQWPAPCLFLNMHKIQRKKNIRTKYTMNATFWRAFLEAQVVLGSSRKNLQW